MISYITKHDQFYNKNYYNKKNNFTSYFGCFRQPKTMCA